MKNDRGLTLRYGLIVSLYWMGFAVLSAFASLYLLDAGFSNTVIGAIVAIAGIVASVLQPALAAWADRADSPGPWRIAGGMAAAIAALCAVILAARQVSAVVCALLYTCALVVLQSAQPFVNAIGMETLNQGRKLNYGVSRASGSVAYAAIAWGLGLLAAAVGAWSVPASACLCFALMTAAALLYPLKRESGRRETAGEKSSGSVIAFLKRYPRYGIVLVGLVLIYTSHTYLNSFTLQIVTPRGGGSAEMGTTTAIAAVVELIPMVSFAALSKRFRCDVMLKLSGFFFMFKSLCTQLSGTMAGVYGAQLFQILGWGLMSVVLVYYVNGIMRPEDRVKGQAYATTTYTLGVAIAGLTGGRLLDLAGAQALLTASTIAAGLGAVVLVIGAQRTALPDEG